MIIPIGQENSQVRRLPLVTFAVILACVAVHLQISRSGSEALQAALSELDDAEAYFYEHPYLEPDPRLAEVMFPGLDEEQREAEIEGLLEEHDGDVFEFQIEPEQARLDDLVEGAYQQLARQPERRLGLVAAHPSALGWLTHMFTHAGWGHLLGNMLLLFIVGCCLEDVWGRPLYGAFYLASGLAAAGLFVARYPELDIPLVGASGAVSGVMGAFLVRYWSTRIRFFYWIGLWWRGTFEAPAWVVLPLFFGQELLSAVAMDALLPGSGGGGVAHWAHVGGFSFGVAVAFAIARLQLEERYIHPAIESKITFLSNPAVEEGLAARASGNLDQAFRVLEAELRRNPGNYDAAVALWDAATDLGRAGVAAPALVRVIREDLQKGNAELAHARWQELCQRAPGARIDVPLVVRLGSALIEREAPQLGCAVFRHLVEGGHGPLAAPLAARVANIVRRADPPIALRAARIALAAPDLDLSDRRRLESLAQELAPSDAGASQPAAARSAPEPEIRAGAIHAAEPAPALLGESEPEPPTHWELDEEARTPFEANSTFDLGGDDPSTEELLELMNEQAGKDDEEKPE